MPSLLVLNICIQTQKQLTTLNNFWALLRSVLIDLHACNFMHAKTSLRVCYVHAHHHTYNLLSPTFNTILNRLLFQLVAMNIYWKQSLGVVPWNQLKVSECFFFLEIKKYCFFLHKTMEKPYLNLHVTFHNFFPWNNEDIKVLSFGFFSFQT